VLRKRRRRNFFTCFMCLFTIFSGFQSKFHVVAHVRSVNFSPLRGEIFFGQIYCGRGYPQWIFGLKSASWCTATNCTVVTYDPKVEPCQMFSLSPVARFFYGPSKFSTSISKSAMSKNHDFSVFSTFL